MPNRLPYLIPGAALAALAGYALFAGRAEQPVLAAPAIAMGHPVAVELFTSQGCSSCPPADALLERLSGDPRVIAISRPVTYWDRLGWKDTLAMAANTALQQGYAGRHIPGAGVYTPQAVVQGVTGTVGSRAASLSKLIDEQSKQPEIAITVRSGASPMVTLSGTPSAPATVQLIGLDSSADVRIGSGENGGRRVRYVNVLKNEATIAKWRGGPLAIAIDRAKASARDVDRYAVIVRQGDAGPILAARYL